MIDERIVQQIIAAGEGSPEERVVLGNALPLTQLTFAGISPKEAPLLAIDGGQADLFISPTVALQYFRFGAVRWKNGKAERLREEWTGVLRKKAVGYEAELTPLQKNAKAFPHHIVQFAEDEIALLDGGMRGNIVRLGGIIRKIGELGFAHALQEAECVVLDGNLQTTHGECEKLIGQLDPLVGFSKTADLFTTEGRQLTTALESRAPAGRWLSSSVASVRQSYNFNVHFAKLHPRAQHVFRLDIPSNVMEHAAALAACSSDPVFFGYPYPLIVADQLARISNEEKEGLKMVLIARAGKDYPVLRSAMHALDAHSVLDSIR